MFSAYCALFHGHLLIDGGKSLRAIASNRPDPRFIRRRNGGILKILNPNIPTLGYPEP